MLLVAFFVGFSGSRSQLILRVHCCFFLTLASVLHPQKCPLFLKSTGSDFGASEFSTSVVSSAASKLENIPDP